MILGSRQGVAYFLNGDIAEVLIYATTLSSMLRDSVERYLSDRYAITSGALPVELAAFTATTNRSVVVLRWNTATEINNYGFNVERKSDGGKNSASWQTLAFVCGSGTSAAGHAYSFTDATPPGGRSVYRLKQIDNGGTFKYSDETTATIDVPRVFALEQNYPNPFNPSTTISFTLAEDSRVSLKVFDVMGREVATLVNEHLKSGERHDVVFDASHLASGMYLYRLDASTGSASGTMSLVKKFILMK